MPQITIPELVSALNSLKNGEKEANESDVTSTIEEFDKKLELATRITKNTGFWASLFLLAIGISGTGIYTTLSNFTFEKYWGGTLSSGTAWYYMGTNQGLSNLIQQRKFPITSAFNIERKGIRNLTQDNKQWFITLNNDYVAEVDLVVRVNIDPKKDGFFIGRAKPTQQSTLLNIPLENTCLHIERIRTSEASETAIWGIGRTLVGDEATNASSNCRR